MSVGAQVGNCFSKHQEQIKEPVLNAFIFSREQVMAGNSAQTLFLSIKISPLIAKVTQSPCGGMTPRRPTHQRRLVVH